MYQISGRQPSFKIISKRAQQAAWQPKSWQEVWPTVLQSFEQQVGEEESKYLQYMLELNNTNLEQFIKKSYNLYLRGKRSQEEIKDVLPDMQEYIKKNVQRYVENTQQLISMEEMQKKGGVLTWVFGKKPVSKITKSIFEKTFQNLTRFGKKLPQAEIERLCNEGIEAVGRRDGLVNIIKEYENYIFSPKIKKSPKVQELLKLHGFGNMDVLEEQLKLLHISDAERMAIISKMNSFQKKVSTEITFDIATKTKDPQLIYNYLDDITKDKYFKIINLEDVRRLGSTGEAAINAAKKRGFLKWYVDFFDPKNIGGGTWKFVKATITALLLGLTTLGITEWTTGVPFVSAPYEWVFGEEPEAETQAAAKPSDEYMALKTKLEEEKINMESKGYEEDRWKDIVEGDIIESNLIDAEKELLFESFGINNE